MNVIKNEFQLKIIFKKSKKIFYKYVPNMCTLGHETGFQEHFYERNRGEFSMHTAALVIKEGNMNEWLTCVMCIAPVFLRKFFIPTGSGPFSP